jgi:hypothetical protein
MLTGRSDDDTVWLALATSVSMNESLTIRLIFFRFIDSTKNRKHRFSIIVVSTHVLKSVLQSSFAFIYFRSTDHSTGSISEASRQYHHRNTLELFDKTPGTSPRLEQHGDLSCREIPIVRVAIDLSLPIEDLSDQNCLGI